MQRWQKRWEENGLRQPAPNTGTGNHEIAKICGNGDDYSVVGEICDVGGDGDDDDDVGDGDDDDDDNDEDEDSDGDGPGSIILQPRLPW